MGTTGQRVSAFLLELETELADKERVIRELQAQLADRSAAVPAALGVLIEQQQALLDQSREVLRSLESDTASSTSAEEVRQLRDTLDRERNAHSQQVARLIGELDTARDAARLAIPDADEGSELRAQLESERESHQKDIAALTAQLEAARESEAALEASLMEQRGAIQRIEAKFSLYAAAVSKLAELPAAKPPKLLWPSKQVPPRKLRAGGLPLL